MINANNRITSNNMINHANNRITPTNMINQRNKLMTYFLPRGGRFLAALCAGFSVQRRNQMLLSALLLLSSFALLPDVFAQTDYLSYSVTTDDGYVVSFSESESKYHIGINGATEDTRTNLAIANHYAIFVNQDGHGVYQNAYEQRSDSCDVSLIECGSELRNPDKSFVTSGSGYPGFEPTRPFTVKITITPSEFFSSDGLQRVKALVTFPTPTLPSQITDLAATAGDGAVELTWTASNLNGGTFENYTITYGGETKKITSHSTTSTTISNLNNGEEYTFTIITHRSAGSSAQSNEQTISALAPLPPSQITDLADSVTTDDGYVVSFEESESKYHFSIDGANNDTLENLALNHRTTMSVVQDGNTAYTNDYERLARSYSVPVTNCTRDLDPDTECTLEILNPDKSFVTSRNGYPGFDPTRPFTVHFDMTPVSNDFQNVAVVVTFPTPALPSQITDLAATAGVGTVTLTWTPPNLNGGTFSRYDIFYEDDNANETILEYSTDRITLPILHTRPETFKIRTQTSAGFSAQSNEQTISALAPLPPSQITDLADSVTTDDGYVVSFEESESKYHFSIDGANNDTLENLALNHRTTMSVVQDGNTAYTNDYERLARSYSVPVTNCTRDLDPDTECTLEILNPDKSFVTSRNGYPGFDPTRPFTVHFDMTPVSNDFQNVAVVVTFPTPALPSQITDLEATAGNGAVDLTWTPPNLNGGTFAHYTITYGGETKKITSHSTTSTTIPDLNNGEEYTFTIITHRSAGSSLQSNAVTVTLPTVPPSQITDLRAVAGVGEIALNWTAPNLNGGTFVNYYIYNGVGGIIETISDHSTISKTFTFPNVAPQSFSIRTETSVGLGSRSNTVTISALAPQPPSQITDLAATVTTDDGYVVSFSESESKYHVSIDGANNDTLENLALNHRTTMSVVQDGNTAYTNDYERPARSVTDCAGSSNPVADCTLEILNPKKSFVTSPNGYPGFDPTRPFTVNYHMTRVSNDFQNVAVVVTFPTPALPSQITDLAATAGNGAVDLTWTPPNLNGGTFAHYTITYGGETVRITPHSTTSTTIPDLNNGEEYTFTIITHRSAGSSAQSNAVTVTLPTVPPSQITDLSATADVGTITLTWTASDLNGGTFILYDIFYEDGDATETIHDHSTTSRTLTFPNVAPQTFKIRTQTSAGFSPQSNAVTISALAPLPPSQITDLAATVGDGEVTLTWTAPVDNGVPVADYELQRNQIVEGVSNPLPLVIVPLSSLTVVNGLTTYTVPDLSNGDSYTFSLAARNAGGGKGPTTATTDPATPNPKPGALSGGMITASPGQVALSWTAAGSGATPTTHRIRITPPEGEVFDEFADGDVTEYIVRNLSIEGVYGFAISAGNTIGYGPPLTTSVNVISGPTTAPGQVTGLTAVAGNEKVTLSWDAPDNGRSINAYGIIRLRVSDGSRQFQRIDTTETTFTWRLELSNGTEYSFRVYAITDAENGPDSAKVIVTPTLTAPIVSDLEATPGTGRVTLTWRLDDGGSALTGYVLTVTPAVSPPPPPPTAATINIANDGGISYQITGLTNGTSYTFSLSANNAVDDGPVVSATATPATKPGPITNDSATPGDEQVTLRWTPPTDTGGAPLVDYDITIVPTPASGEGYPRPSGMDTEYIATGLTNGTEYQFFLTQRNAAKRGDGIMLVATPNLAPAQVAVTATPGNGQVTLSWPLQAGLASPITGYDITVTPPVGEPIPVLLNATATTAKYTVPSLANGTEYTFTVFARSATGDGPPSDSVPATPSTDISATAPSIVSNLTAEAKANGTITLKWLMPANGGSPLEDYRLQVGYDLGGGDEDTIDSVPQPSGTATEHILSAELLKSGRIHYISMRATNAVGDSPHVLVIATALVPSPPPAVPTDLTATAGNEQVTLSWTAPVDNGVPVADYELQISLIVEGVSMPFPLVIVPLSSLTVVNGVTTYTVSTGLTNGDSYTFSLAARNADEVKGAAEMITATPVIVTAPGPVTKLVGLSENEQITLSWIPPFNDGGSAITEYAIEVIKDGVSVEVVSVSAADVIMPPAVGMMPSDVRTYSVPNLTNQIEYTFTIYAKNIAGDGPPVTLRRPLLVGDASRLSQVEIVKVEAGDQKVTLTWIQPDNDGSTLTGYGLRVEKVSGGALGGIPSPGVDDTTITITNRRLINGTPFAFFLFAENELGGSILETRVTATPNLPPAPVTGLTAVAGDTSVTLSWIPPVIAEGESALDEDYVLEVTLLSDGSEVTLSDGSPLTQPIATATTHLVEGLTNGQAYEFSLSPRNANEIKGAAEMVTATPSNATVPAAVSRVGLTAAVSDGEVTLTWIPPDNGGSSLEPYTLEIYDEESAEFVVPSTSVIEGTANTYTVVLKNTVPRVPNGMPITFFLTAHNAIGPSPLPAAFISVTPPITEPEATVLDTEANNGEITLSWTPPYDGGSPITGYLLTGIDDDSISVDPPQPGVDAVTIVVPGLRNRVRHWFGLFAINAVGTATSGVLFSETPSATKPTRVTDLTAVAGNETVTLNWTAPANNGGSDILDYNLQIVDPSNRTGTEPRTALSSTTPTHTVTTGLTNGTAYEFHLRATNTNGDSASEFITATPVAVAATLPDAVLSADLTAEAGNGTVTLRWPKPDDGGSTLLPYILKVFRDDGGDDTDITNEVVEEGQPIGTATDIEIDELTNGKLHTFTLRTVNGVGAASFPLATVKATPGTPGKVELRLDDEDRANGQVILRWKRPDNRGSALGDYLIEVVDLDNNNTPIEDQPIAPRGNSLSVIVKLTNGVRGNYEFRLTATNRHGEGPQASVRGRADTTKPARINDLTAEAGNGQITLHWTKPHKGDSDITEYVLDVRDVNDDAFTWPAPSADATEHTVGGLRDGVSAYLTNGSAYFFNLVAVNDGGNGPNARVNDVFPDSSVPLATVPAEVTLTAEPGDTTVMLSWPKPANGGSTLQNYKLEVSYNDAISGEEVELDVLQPSGTATTHLVTGLTNGIEHYFILRATNAIGEGPRQATVRATPGTPDAPTGLTAVAINDGTVTLSWTAPDNTGGSPIANYKLRIVDLPDRTEILSLTALDSTVTTYTVPADTGTGLTKGTQYEFQVRATNAVNDGPTATATETPGTAPAAVINLIAEGGNTTVTLRWDAPDNGGAPITYYGISITKPNRYTHIPGSGPNIPGSGPKTFLKFDNTINGTTYTFEVFARNRFGDSPKVEVSGTSGAPGAVTGLTAVANDDGTVTLSWALPRKKDGSVSNGGFPITGYKLQIVESGGTEISPLTAIDIPDLNDLTYSVPVDTGTGLIAGTEYEFHIVATNGNVDGEDALDLATPAAVTPATVPAQMTGLTGRIGSSATEIRLSWTAPDNVGSTSANGGSLITTYTIRVTPAEGGREPYNATRNFGFDGTRFYILASGIGIPHTFTISATNGVGDGPPSAEFTITPRAPGPPNPVTDLKATAGDTTVTLNWTAPLNDGGSDISHYIIGRSGSVETVERRVALGTSYEYTGLTNNTPYTFTVSAKNTSGNSADESITASPSTVPDQINVLTLKAKPGDRAVTLSWTVPFNGGSAITGYDIDVFDSELDQIGETKTLDRSSTIITTTDPDSTIVTDTHTFTTLDSSGSGPRLTNGDDYTFALAARNVVGDGPFQRTDPITPVGPIAPQAVTDLAAAANRDHGNGQVTLSWMPPNNRGSGITHYKLRIVDLPDRTEISPLTELSGIDATSLNLIRYTVPTATGTGLTNGTEYEFQVKAANDTVGDSPDATVNETVGTKPAAMNSVTGVPNGSGRIKLSWTLPDNGGSDILDYKLQVNPLGTSALGEITIPRIPRDRMTYTVTGLVNGRAHIFYLHARNEFGKGPVPRGINKTPRPDTTPPVIVLTDGDVTLNFGDTYTEPGFTVTDNVDVEAEITGRIVITGDTVDTTVAGTYRVTYTVTDVAGNAATLDRMVTVTAPATLPAAVTGLVIKTVGDGSLELEWTAPVDNGGPAIDGYSLTVTPAPNPSTDGTTDPSPILIGKELTEYPVERLTNGTEYTFTLLATNADGDGPAETTTGIPATAPEQVGDLTAVAGDGTVTLSWIPPLRVNTGGPPLADYELTVTPAEGTPFTISIDKDLAIVEGRISYTVTGPSAGIELANGKLHIFLLTTRNEFKEAAPQTITATPGRPGVVPSLDAVFSGPGVVVLTWAAPTDGGSPSGYPLRVNSALGTAFSPPQPGADDTTSTISSRLVTGIEYTFSIFARNGAGDSIQETSVTVGPPDAINDLTAVASNETVTLSWTPPDDGGSPLTEYVLTATSSDGSTVPPIPQPAVTTTTAMISHPVPGLTNGVLYTFALVARSLAGDSPSADVPATPGAVTEPEAVIDLAAAVNGDNGQVTLSWTAPANGGSDINAYKLRIVDTSNETGNEPLTTLSGIDVTSMDFTYPVPTAMLTIGTAYKFYVIAANDIGNGPDAFAPATPSTKPGQITILTPAAGDTTVTLSWTPPDNGGSDILDYELEVTEVVGGTARPVITIALSSLTPLVNGVTSYPVPNLTNDTAYSFSLVARNVHGKTPKHDQGATATPVSGVIPDMILPVIEGVGDDPVILRLGGTYTKADALVGVTATDDVDGIITAAIDITGLADINVSTRGSYTITYNVMDVARNAAAPKTRTVIVADVPGPVTGLTAIAGDRQVTLSWTAPTDNGGSPITGYLRRITGGDGVIAELTLPKEVAPRTFPGLMNGTSYTFSLVAVNAVGESLPETVPASPALPGTPDTTPPVISLVDDNVSLVRGSTYTEADARAGVTALDDRDGVIARSKIIIDITGVDTTTDGTYSVTYNVEDIAGNNAEAIGMVTITAPTKPAQIVLIATAGDRQVTLSWTPPDNGGSPISQYNLLVLKDGRTADGSGIIVPTPTTPMLTYIVPNLDNGIEYTFTLTARNPQGDSPAATQTVTPVGPDTTPPVISPNDPATVSLELGYPYSDAGAVTATDNIDGVITSAIDIDLTGLNINAVGTYTITYTVMDKAGNKSAPVTRMVMVTADMTPPVISPNEPATASLEVGGSYTEADAGAGVTATDNIDGDITSAIEIDITDVNVNVVGTYTVTYNVEDDADNDAIERTRMVMVTADMTNPVITQTGSATVILERGSTYTEADVRAGVTATDNIDDDISGDIVIDGSVDTSRIGTYTLTYTVMDSTNNPAAPVIRMVTIVSPIPSANAGVDQLVVPGADVILSGSGTDVKDDAAGTALRYVWRLTSGTLESPGLSDENTATARFTAATAVTSTVIYVFTLTVTDSDGNSGTDTVTISVTSEIAITKDIDKQNKVVLPSMGRAIAYQNINAISTRISQVGGANRKNSLGGNTNAVDILKSIERLNKDSSLSAKEALGNSRFAVALDGIGAAFWGKIDYQKFKGTDQNVKYNGALFSSTLGVEGQINNRARLGLALSHTKSDIDYTDSAPIISATSGGDYEIVMLSVNPYISWKPSDDVDLWATLGYGQGDLELILADSDRLRSSDLRQKTAAVGGSGVLLDGGIVELRLKGEALKTRFEVDKSEGIAALALDATRMRVGLEGSHALSLENGASLNSSVELGVRYDSGDGQTGSRGEVGGRLEYSNGRGLTLQGNARMLVGGDDYDEWGLGGLLKFQPSTDGRGISFNLGLGQGSTVSKTEDIWKNALTNKSTSTANHSTTSIKLGYGITAPYWLGGSAYGILTPYTEVKLGNSNSYDLGLDWRVDPSVGFKLNVKNQSDSVNSINLEGEIRF